MLAMKATGHAGPAGPAVAEGHAAEHAAVTQMGSQLELHAGELSTMKNTANQNNC